MSRSFSTWLRPVAVAAAIGVFAAVGYVILRPRTHPSKATESRSIDDPRLTYQGPYRNIHPSVQFVGDEACAKCHDIQAETFRNHPMGRSMFPLSKAPNHPPIDKEHHNPFEGLSRLFRVEQDKDRIVHHEFRAKPDGAPIYDFPMEVKYVVGSGTHAQSYFWEKDGYVLQTPISWYGQKKIWDVSPGWLDVGGGRAVDGTCMFCHSNRVEPMAGSANRYAAPLFRGHTIGCERCHGPGEIHVAHWKGQLAAEKPEYTIVNPRKLPWREREAVCRQCHSEGETRFVKRGRGLFDFRPGLPLEDFWAIVVLSAGEEEFKVVNHVEQLERSQCFKKSSDANKIGCISCHDPHVKPAASARVKHYRQSCLKCHEQHPCAMPEPDRRRQQSEDSCIACHMPKESTLEIPHISGTDHRIMRRPTSLAEHPKHPRLPPGVLPVRLLHRRPGAELTAEDRRDLGVALAKLIAMNKIDGKYAARALELLEEALGTAANDATAWEAKSAVLAYTRKLDEAYAAIEEALKLEPNSESILQAAAMIAMATRRNDQAIDLWNRVRDKNPYRPLPAASLTILHIHRQEWRDAKEAADEWLRWEPGAVEARRLRTLCHLRLRDRAAAESDMAIIEALRPANLADIQAWWKAETQRPRPPVYGPQQN